MASKSLRSGRSARVHGVLGAGLGAVSGAAIIGTGVGVVAGVIARSVVTPPRRRTDDVRIHAVDLDAGRITLQLTHETEVDGHYGFWFEHGAGYARLGPIVSITPDRVERIIDELVFGQLNSARAGRWSGWYFLSPEDLGHPWYEASIATTLGAAPAWVVPAETPGPDWAIFVHGRGVIRSESLRAVEPFRQSGFTCLVASYRNDGEAPSSDDGRYALGGREWEDIDAALRFAVQSGARRVVLMGWSMGGAIVLQTLARSPLASARSGIVIGAVLESPVVDWVQTIDYQVVRMRRLPRVVRSLVVNVLSSPLSRPVAGVAEPIDFAALDFVARANEVDRPLLVLASDGDDFVPAGAAKALARRRPDMVRLELFEQARHTRLWNHDPERWTNAIREWLGAL